MNQLERIKEQRVLRDLVSPYLCTELLQLGMQNTATVYWMETEAGWKHWTYEYDPDNLYKDSDAIIYATCPATAPKTVIAAYSVGDLMAVLPPLCVTSTKSDYDVACELFAYSAQDSRFPDALARLLINLLSNGYDINIVNHKLNY